MTDNGHAIIGLIKWWALWNPVDEISRCIVDHEMITYFNDDHWILLYVPFYAHVLTEFTDHFN